MMLAVTHVELATIGLALFALLTGLVWAGVIYLRSIALSLRKIADRDE